MIPGYPWAGSGGQKHSQTYQSSTQTSLTSSEYFSSTKRGYPWAEMVARNTHELTKAAPKPVWQALGIFRQRYEDIHERKWWPGTLANTAAWSPPPRFESWFPRSEFWASTPCRLMWLWSARGPGFHLRACGLHCFEVCLLKSFSPFENRESTTRNRLKEFAVVKLNYRCPAVNRIVFKMNNTGSSTWVVGFCSASTHKW